MTNEERLEAGAGLERWFGDWVGALAGTIGGLARGKVMSENGLNNVEAHLTNLRPYVASGTAGLEPAMEAVMKAAEALAATDRHQPDKLETAREAAFVAIDQLVDVLRVAQPSGKAKALYPQPGESGYRPPEPV